MEISQSYDHKCTATFFYGSQCILEIINFTDNPNKTTNKPPT